ncbi:MAG: heme-copper oxidase subunit III [Vicinamibacterales bacterium]
MHHTSLPWSYTPRPDTGTSSTGLGMWLFLASEAMLFGSLFSGYVLLRAGASAWPDATGVLSYGHAALATLLLAGSAAALAGRGGASRARLAGSALLAVVFLVVKFTEYRAKIAAGLVPSANLLLASWFTLTGMHALHVVAGAGWAAWLAGPGWRHTTAEPARRHARVASLRLYWYFVDLVWFGILLGFYIV